MDKDTKQMDRIESKLDKVGEKLEQHTAMLTKHDVLHSKNTDDLKEHMKRTELLEKRTEELYRYKWMALGIISFVLVAVNLIVKAI